MTEIRADIGSEKPQRRTEAPYGIVEADEDGGERA